MPILICEHYHFHTSYFLKHQVLTVQACRSEISSAPGYAQRRSDGLNPLFVGNKYNTGTLVDNSLLQSILLTQIMLKTLNGLAVPRAPQRNTFTYHTNAKEVMKWDLGAEMRNG